MTPKEVREKLGPEVLDVAAGLANGKFRMAASYHDGETYICELACEPGRKSTDQAMRIAANKIEAQRADYLRKKF